MNLTPSTKRILSFSEQQVLQLISEGCSIEEIPVVLLLSPYTLETIEHNISKKLNTYYITEAVQKARVMNLI
ncbi:MAG TPA: LuxR C-terminal-related transcriptional regulator [Parafilimonas sp.]|nr:LuxR C-terminal-related transcriptional regulator [Parafilimonas sp.]